eukprot:3367372-Rhodomonas_salina.1
MLAQYRKFVPEMRACAVDFAVCEDRETNHVFSTNCCTRNTCSVQTAVRGTRVQYRLLYEERGRWA